MIKKLIQKIRANLTPDLLAPQYRKEAIGPMDGHCYVATECFYYVYGKDHGWKPMCGAECTDELKVSTHWWLEKDGIVLDITAAQFPDGYDYSIGRKQFFVSYPSKRCLTLVERIENV